MIVLLSPGLLAVILAIVRRRSLAGLACQRISWWPLGFASLAAEFAVSSTPLGEHSFILAWGSAIWTVALTAVALMLARNAWLRSTTARWAWGAAAFGVIINILVVITNGGYMPQSQEARISAGASAEQVTGLASRPGWRNVAPMTPETHLAWLGDVLPEPDWLPVRNVMSFGDLLLACGLAAVIYLATTPATETLGTNDPPDMEENARGIPLDLTQCPTAASCA